MSPLTIVQYLVGSRSAIERIAACRQAPWLGLIFVFSAALAREYDGQDLLHEPWHLALPLVASLATSFLLYLLLRVVGLCRGAGWKPFFAGYWSFLGLYWMTAPLALLYAIPVERFFDAADATRANLALLGIVSLWRVLLITRVASVLWQSRFLADLFPVMLFAATVAVIAVAAMPKPIVGLMGGVRFTEAEEVILAVSGNVMAFGTCSWPLWLIGTVVVARLRRPTWCWSVGEGGNVSPWSWLIAAVSVVAFLPALFVHQPAQQLGRQVEFALRSGRVNEALHLMSQHERSDFPPLWDPPPRIGYRMLEPPILEVMDRIAKTETKPWVRQIFLEKYKYRLSSNDYHSLQSWSSMREAELRRHIEILEQLPERDEVIADNYLGLLDLLKSDRVSEELKDRIRSVLGERAKEAGGDRELSPERTVEGLP